MTLQDIMPYADIAFVIMAMCVFIFASVVVAYSLVVTSIGLVIVMRDVWRKIHESWHND